VRLSSFLKTLTTANLAKLRAVAATHPTAFGKLFGMDTAFDNDLIIQELFDMYLWIKKASSRPDDEPMKTPLKKARARPDEAPVKKVSSRPDDEKWLESYILEYASLLKVDTRNIFLDIHKLMNVVDSVEFEFDTLERGVMELDYLQLGTSINKSYVKFLKELYAKKLEEDEDLAWAEEHRKKHI